ncbi:MAG TPA: D-glycerate dehydrogenase [Roseiflexaceae bacterium]|nr:D-glycerate dehydrogenase [Roseiflexaceae bacterium]
MTDLPRVYVTRHIPQAALDLLAQHVSLSVWPGEQPPPRAVVQKEAVTCDGLLTMVTDRVDAALLEAAPRLLVVSNYGVGYDNIDLAAATEQGVLVTNTPDVLTEATADLAFALILATARRLGEAEQYVKAGRWRFWGPELLLGRELSGATLGLVGLGRIGAAVARRAQGFGMHVLYHTPRPKPEAETGGLRHAPLEQLLAESDIVSLHCPLNDDTYHLIDRDALALLKPDALLVNTARGSVVDTRALVEALRQRPQMVAALDVTDPEPMPADHELLALPNALVVPHIGSATVQARTRMGTLAAQNLLAALRGERPPSLVNPEAWGRRRT